MKKARTEGTNIENLSQWKTDLLFLESRLFSLGKTASQLKCWRDDALEVLQYARGAHSPRGVQIIYIVVHQYFPQRPCGHELRGFSAMGQEMHELCESCDNQLLHKCFEAPGS